MKKYVRGSVGTFVEHITIAWGRFDDASPDTKEVTWRKTLNMTGYKRKDVYQRSLIRVALVNIHV